MNNNDVIKAGEVTATPESTLDPIISEAFIEQMRDASVYRFGGATSVTGRADEVKASFYKPVEMLARKLSESMLKIQKNILLDMMGIIYPVGSVYMTFSKEVTEITLKANFGGTWERTANGRVLVGVDDKDEDFKEGITNKGKKIHTLTVTEMPAHSHYMTKSLQEDGVMHRMYGAGDTWVGLSNITKSSGGGGSHNNLQPYMTCYIWKRTA